MDIFESPERRADCTFLVKLATPVKFGEELEWKRDAEFPTPDLRIQPLINGFREKTLRDLTRNKVLFKSPPTLAALSALAPTWGLLLRGGGAAEWNRQDCWNEGVRQKGAGSRVALVALGVIISRQSIVPVWDVEVKGALPESGVVIDLDFGVSDEDGVSVHSDDFASEEGVVKLADTERRKAEAKARVRALMAAASKARVEVDEAMDRFFAEYDLSEDESDFSETEDEDD